MENAFSAPMDEVIKLEIEIWSTGMVLEAGEKLVLKVSGHFMAAVKIEALQGTFSVCNEGSHVVYYGVELASYVEVPVAQT